MEPQDWHLAIPRSPEVGKVQQLAAIQGEAAQEHLGRLSRVQVRQTPRVKEDTGPSALRDRAGGRPGREGRRPRRQPGGAPEAGTQPDRRASHLDVRV
ncbi:MAG: hypothetical protein QME93_01955 [Bacillota bacterium]|nr:hypothetical protein [Bacillota bacterium]MDI7248816.1 hypothetical protein [Bacillota bacterium]